MSRVSFAKPGAAPEVPATAPATVVAPVATTAASTPATVAAPAAATVETPATVTAPAPVAETPAPAAAPVVPVVEDNRAVATVPQTSNAVAAPEPAFFNDDTLDVGDLVLPRLNIVQKVGDLSNKFRPGTLLLNGQLVVRQAPEGTKLSEPINILCIGFNPTTFVEKVEGGLRGKVFKTEQEVIAAGGTLDYNEAKQLKKPKYDRSATAMILIEQPEGLDINSFPIGIEGKNYAFALYTMKGTGYTHGARHIKSSRKIGQCRESYRHGWWSLQSQLKEFSGNWSYVPVVNPIGASTEGLRAAVKDFLGF